jgi:polyvinyl alcohol dehydrogenase (cytochrome)
VHNGANVISVDRETGTLRRMTQVDTHPAAEITGSPVVFDGVVYIGASLSEEGLATDPAYPCCSFRGSVVALDVKTGAMLWKTFDMPDNGGKPDGYNGGALWQPPAIDPKRRTLFIGTGNNYTTPADVEACQNATPTADCAAADDFFDTALALDPKTGQIKWARRLQGTLYWGSGYRNIPPGIGNNKVYAFSWPARRIAASTPMITVSETDGVGVIAYIIDVSCDSRPR